MHVKKNTEKNSTKNSSIGGIAIIYAYTHVYMEYIYYVHTVTHIHVYR